MNNMYEVFPEIRRNIEKLIEDEEGNIPGKKLMMLGTMVIILGNLLSTEIFAAHKSHSSHSSHSSHQSGSSSHGSHDSHASHSSHASHQSHTSHSNTSSHSNSSYSSEGDVSYSAPSAASVPGISSAPATATTKTFKLPKVNQNIEVPNGTPSSSLIPALTVPASTPISKIDAGELNAPPSTEEVR